MNQRPHPPDGAWIEQDGAALTFGASTRTLAFIYLIPMPLFLLFYFGIPALVSSVERTESYSSIVFLILWIAGVLWLGFQNMCALLGEVFITIRNDECIIFYGIHPIGRTCTISLGEISTVEKAENYRCFIYKSGGIKLDGQKSIEFAPLLTGKRRDFIIDRLREVVANQAAAEPVSPAQGTLK